MKGDRPYITFHPKVLLILVLYSSGLLTYAVSLESPSPIKYIEWITIHFAAITVAGTVVDFHNFLCCYQKKFIDIKKLIQ
jgi:hypothetical protein